MENIIDSEKTHPKQIGNESLLKLLSDNEDIYIPPHLPNQYLKAFLSFVNLAKQNGIQGLHFYRNSKKGLNFFIEGKNDFLENFFSIHGVNIKIFHNINNTDKKNREKIF